MCFDIKYSWQWLGYFSTNIFEASAPAQKLSKFIFAGNIPY
jgi:hypothetical protein